MTKLLVTGFLLVSLNSFSQHSIEGKIVDTSETLPLQNAVVSIIRPVDSILIKYTRSSADGSFRISDLSSLNVIVMITYPKYADFIDLVKDTSKQSVNMGQIPLTKKSELLEAVIVQRKLAAIRVRGDTLAYLADSFGVRKGATVDELLKQLPGIQVDRSGAITAHGEKVNKVLVDGEEFFSDDPAVVTKNLQAEAVKEVQVFDKKSEQSEFTGIDDGERTKTINLTLKADKKKGYFAKATLNGGTNNTFDNDVMFNYFKGTKKIAAFGIMSNTGRQGLNWNDMDRFGGGNDIQFNEEEGYWFGSSGDDEFSQDMNYEDGLPAAWSAGLHFSDKWRGENRKLNGNYRFLKKNLNTEGTTRSQYILPDTQYFSDLSRKVFNSKIGHQVKLISEIKFDSLSDMKITLKGNRVTNENSSFQESRSLNADSGLVNTNERLLTGLTSKNNFNADILWRKKFRTVGRTLSVNVQQQATTDQLDGILQSETDYYNAEGGVDRNEKIDQKKANSRESLGVKTNAVYTEPLSKIWFLSFNYGLNYLQSEASRNSFNKGVNSVYDKRDSLFSNDFQYRYLIQSTGADIRLNKKKVTVVMGSGLSFSDYRQTDQLRDSSRSYRFTNFFPKVLLKISPQPYSNFVIRYNGRNNPPTLDQLQPIQENTDPLNVQVGNPGLRQEFVHSLNLNFHKYQVMSERGIYINASGNWFENAISTSTNVDEGGKTILQPINVAGNFSSNLHAGYHIKIKKPGIFLNLGTSASLNRMSNKVNQQDNINTFRNYNLYLYLGKFKNDKYSFSLRPSLGYTFGRSSLRADVPTRYLTSESGADAWIKLPAKFEIWTDVNFYFREKTDVFDVNRNVVRWDASLAKKFMKNNNLELKLFVYDLLNQNIGFNRNANTNIVTESSFVTLRRRFMLGLQYNISKNP
jgi:hypothetical protein